MPDKLPDFGEMGAAIKAREEAEEAAKVAAREEYALAAERTCNRAFKGIIPRNVRKMFAKQTLARLESAGALDSSGGENG